MSYSRLMQIGVCQKCGAKVYTRSETGYELMWTCDHINARCVYQHSLIDEAITWLDRMTAPWRRRATLLWQYMPRLTISGAFPEWTCQIVIPGPFNRTAIQNMVAQRRYSELRRRRNIHAKIHGFTVS